VFMDTVEIRDGSNWPRMIDEALQRATIILPIIGANWFKLTDQFGIPRIQQPADWVRRELEHGIGAGKTVIPIYIGIEPQPAAAFPDSLKVLGVTHSRVIRDGEAEPEWRKLCDSLRAKGMPPLSPEVRYPRATVRLQPYDEPALQAVLGTLDGWRCVASPVPGKEHVTRHELHKVYEFRTFGRAMDFMAQASIEIRKQQHHPRWENIWRTVSVWLATWDLQFQVSELDVELARHLDSVAKRLHGEGK